MSSDVRVLFLADSHLGLDLPVRPPRVKRRRRGDDFLANYAAALEPARQGQVDLVVHGGDVFDRSHVPASLAYQALEPLRRLADEGMPVFVVPGNHERSLLPHTRFAAHPRVHVFDRPRTFRIDVRGTPLALAGFPYERAGVRQLFPSLLEQTGWRPEPGVASLLCMHQCVEGATVGPADFTFRYAADVVRGRDIPAGFAAVLSGHIHRHQVLTSDLSHRPLAAPVLYPGSIERTALAEMGETKGYMILRLAAGASDPGGKTVLHPESGPPHTATPGDLTWEFRPLPARPMIVRQVQADGRDPLALEAVVREIVAAVPEDAVLTIRVDGVLTAGHLRVLSAAHLRTFVPASMNVDIRSEWSARAFSGPRPAPKRDPRSAPSNGPLFD